MALHDTWPDDEPIPAELAAPDDAPDPDATAAEAFDFAASSVVPLGQAVEMLADAEPERWRIVDDDGAEWAMRHIAEATAELAELRARAARWQERIDAWFAQAAEQVARRADFFTAHLEWYGRRERIEHERATISLPSGKVSARQVGAAVEIVDEEALLAWAKDNAPAIVRVREDVLVSELRKVCVSGDDGFTTTVYAETGELIPGAGVRPEHVSVSVKVAGA